MVHQADADVRETIKRSVIPYFVLEGNICALMGTKDHVNVFIYDPTVPDPDGRTDQPRARERDSPCDPDQAG